MGEAMATAWKMTPTAHVVEIDVPGLSMEQVAVTFDDDRWMTVRCESPPEEEPPLKDGEICHFNDLIPKGNQVAKKYDLKTVLDEDYDVDVGRMHRDLVDGVLTIIIPRRPTAP